MGLTQEAVVMYPGFQTGDIKMAHYAITYTNGAITKPSNDPEWMLLNGASLSTTTYPGLFSLFGYSYGGSGSSFHLPDLTNGRLPITKGLTNFITLGATGGEINHTLTTTEIASHTHSHNLSFAAAIHGHSIASVSLSQTDGNHSHTATNAGASGTVNASAGLTPYTVDVDGANNATSTGTAGAHTHTGSMTINPATSSITTNGGVSNNTGGGGSHNNMQPYIVIGGWLVKFG